MLAAFLNTLDSNLMFAWDQKFPKETWEFYKKYPSFPDGVPSDSITSMSKKLSIPIFSKIIKILHMT